MAKQKMNSFSGLGGLVFSTNPDAMIPEAEDIIESLAPNQQLLRVLIDKKKRAGKVVTIIEGFVGTEEDLTELAKKLKTKCGVGGSSKDGIILIQGDYKQKIADYLREWNYKVKVI